MSVIVTSSKRRAHFVPFKVNIEIGISDRDQLNNIKDEFLSGTLGSFETRYSQTISEVIEKLREEIEGYY